MLVSNNTKDFEKPDSGMFTGVLADVIDVGLQPTAYGPKAKVRLVWILNAKDTEGNYYRVMTQATASLNEKARLYQIVKDILGSAPPVPYELDGLIGKVNQLVIVREKSADGTKVFANVKAIIPAPPGTTFAVPQGFVRQKDKKQGTANTAAPVAASQVPATSVQISDEDIPF